MNQSSRHWNPVVAHLQLRLRAREVAALRFLDTPVRDPRGGITTVDAALERMAEAHRRITADEQAGSEQHRRISRGQRWLLRLLPLLDGLILFWFLTGILNADLRTIDTTVIIAAALALLCTVAVAAWTATVGEHLRRYKDIGRNLVWGAVDGLGRGMVVLTALMCALLAAMMYVRVSDEVFQATGVAGVGAIVIAITLAAAVVLVNGYVLYLSFSDGDSVTTELDRLGRVVSPHLRRRDRDLSQAGEVARRIEARLVAEERLRWPTETQPVRRLPDAEAIEPGPGEEDDRPNRWWR